jgi:hypothetical protein
MVSSAVEKTLPLRSPELFRDMLPGRHGLIHIMGKTGKVI